MEYSRFSLRDSWTFSRMARGVKGQSGVYQKFLCMTLLTTYSVFLLCNISAIPVEQFFLSPDKCNFLFRCQNPEISGVQVAPAGATEVWILSREKGPIICKETSDILHFYLRPIFGLYPLDYLSFKLSAQAVNLDRRYHVAVCSIFPLIYHNLNALRVAG